MADLRLDLGRLREMSGNLDEIAARFGNAGRFGDEVAFAVGPIGALQGQVYSFSGNWDDTRRGIQENLTSLSDSLEMISQTFEDLDAQLATHADALAPR
jgi:methyl-accepting chemotaxis protein